MIRLTPEAASPRPLEGARQRTGKAGPTAFARQDIMVHGHMGTNDNP
jgi:hypothetical protein